jgi:nitrite reductase (NADH) large subunit
VGGLTLKGRSGWCSSLCPLLPVQRLYGQSPLLVVRNGHCEPCLGCSINCYDFNPRVAQAADLADEERGPARLLFAGAFPGVAIAFFTTSASASAGEFYARTAVAALAGAGLIFLLATVVDPTRMLLTAAFGAAALNLFYWYLLPKLGVPSALSWAERGALLALTAVWLWRAARAERAIAAEEAQRSGTARLDPQAAAVLAEGDGLVEVTAGDRRVAVTAGTTLLEVAERLDLPVEPGCRMGVCGSDPVYVLAGAESLSPIGQDEKRTLERLGLSEGTRMACCARVAGPVTLTLDTAPGTERAGAAVGDPAIETVVIVGNGIAGVTAAEHVRRNHGSCTIHLIGRERHHLYNRMAITRLIYGRSGMQGLYLLPESWYDENGITTWLNTHAERIDLEQRHVELGTGEQLAYDRLIVTAGGSNFVPEIEGWGASGSFAVRTADDAMEIRAHLQRRRSTSAVLAGGGLLGLEAAYALVKFGLGATVVQRGNRLLPRQLDARGGIYLREYLEGLGIRFELETEVAAVVGDPVEGVRLANGRELEAQLLLVTAGIVSNQELASDAGLETRRGIVVDDRMAASDPHVFAAGDVAEHRGVVWGLWPSAVEQARVAAVNALGGDERYEPIAPATMLKVSGVDLTSVGRIECEDGDDEIAIEEPSERRYRKVILREGRAEGGVLLGHSRESAGLVAAVQQRRDLSEHRDALAAGDWSALLDAAPVPA